jgi:hypothetical protein
MTIARIYQPAKTATQSGKGKTGRWCLEFVPEKAHFTDPLMGWTGMTDMPQEIRLFFPTAEAAAAYAKKQRIAFEIHAPNAMHQVRKAYADNFKANKRV